MQENSQKLESSDEISLAELIQKAKEWYAFLKTKWKQILLVGFIGGCIGFVYAWLQPINYTAKISFIVEEGKSSSGGGLAALAGQFGFDVGGGGSGNSILAGDNILLYLKSESLVRETLLSPYDSSKNYSLADKYADLYELRKSWEMNETIGKVFFPSSQSKGYSIKQDSLLKGIISNVLTQLKIERPEKKATFIVAQVTFNDQILAKLFCERLVYLTTEKYIDIKTTRQKNNVNKLQTRADILESELNKKTYSSTDAMKKLMDLNPLFKAEATNVEIAGRDKMVLQTIYGEIVKNLEIARVTLNQETPVIQVVDRPYLPLLKEKKSRLNYAILYSIILEGLFIIFLIAKKYLNDLKNKR